MKFGLRRRILVLVAAAVGLFAAVILGVVFWVARVEMQSAIRNTSAATSRALARNLESRIATIVAELRLVAELPIVKSVMQTRDEATIGDVLRSYVRTLGVDVLDTADESGALIGSSRGPIAGEHRHLDATVLRAVSSGEAWRGIVVKNGRPTLVARIPITFGERVVGSLGVEHEVGSALATEIRELADCNVAFVVDERVVAASLPLAGLRRPSRQGEVLTVGGTRYVAMTRPMPLSASSGSLSFVPLIPYDAITAPYHRVARALGLLSILALALAVLGGSVLARGITGPLESVVRAAEVVREGHWPEPIPVERGDELGLLQSAFNDMSHAMRANQERLLGMLDTDLLTALPNHRAFHERLGQEVARAHSGDEPLSLVLLDIDRFCDLNAERGHAWGDHVLAVVARSLDGVLPEFGVLARYGGEEFAALLPGLPLDEARQVADELHQTVHRLRYTAEPMELSSSLGCAQLSATMATASDLVLAAEFAVARAKQEGRNRVAVYRESDSYGLDPVELQRVMRDPSFASMRALAAAVDAKDPYTHGHSERVAQYAADLARFLGMSEAELEIVYMTGTVHDVGKIGVPDHVLQKPGALDPDERRIIESHVVLGEVIVRKVPQLSATLPGVRHHHERWDGGGYPDGLAGEEIPLIGRLLALADTFDAMTSDRPYRAGMPKEKALSIIEKEAGTQFDPGLAFVFVRMMREALRIDVVEAA